MHEHTHPWDSMQHWESEDAVIAVGAVTKGKFGDADCLLCNASDSPRSE